MGNFRGLTNEDTVNEGDEKNVFGKDQMRNTRKVDKELFADEPEDIPPPDPIEPLPEGNDADQGKLNQSRKRRRGGQSTILTGDLAPEKKQKKKSTLG